MWLEVKAMFTVGALICVCIALSSAIHFQDLLQTLMLIIAFGLMLFGDIAFGYKVIDAGVIPCIDKNPPNYETCILQEFSGNITFEQTKKGPFGKREFVKHHTDASIINTGDCPIRLPNGNIGFIGHVDYDMNVNIYEAEALDKLEGEDIKEIYKNPVRKKPSAIFNRKTGKVTRK